MAGSMIPRPVIAGNWKMHKSPAETGDFLSRFLSLYQPDQNRTVALFPTALSLTAARESRAGRTDVLLGVQNVHWEISGAFTGEISGAMAREAGAAMALVGHSERRQLFGESDAWVATKTLAVLRAGLAPIVCVGETLDERRSGRLEEVLLRQLDAVLDAVVEDDWNTILLAYEPVWAIGTGVVATPEDAAEAHALLRRRLRRRVGRHADRTPILYGGSVKAENAAALLAASDVDGLLVGGASLDPETFAAIARS